MKKLIKENIQNVIRMEKIKYIKNKILSQHNDNIVLLPDKIIRLHKMYFWSNEIICVKIELLKLVPWTNQRWFHEKFL